MRELALRLFKVPLRPQPPPGSADSLQVFRASPRFFQYSIATWSVKQVGALVGLVVSFATFGWIELGLLEDIALLQSLERLVLIAAGILYVVQIPVSLAMLRLGYEMRWYMVCDRSLRIREGIYRVREQTMTVANIQNMSIRQGPLQRLFGIADLEVQTAGGGGGDEEGKETSQLHRGRLRGLDNARQVRDVIRRALGRHRDAGLGDPDEVRDLAEPEAAASMMTPAAAGFGDAQPPARRSSPLLAAVEQVLAETRGLRRDLGSA